MDRFSEKTIGQRIAYLLYEFIGCVILTMIVNSPSTSKPALSASLFAVSLLSWEVSAAQFNMGITIAQFVYHIKEIEKSIVPIVLVLIVQALGTFTGLGLSTLAAFEDNY